jgi:hypothetical protein
MSFNFIPSPSVVIAAVLFVKVKVPDKVVSRVSIKILSFNPKGIEKSMRCVLNILLINPLLF